VISPPTYGAQRRGKQVPWSICFSGVLLRERGERKPTRVCVARSLRRRPSSETVTVGPSGYCLFPLTKRGGLEVNFQPSLNRLSSRCDGLCMSAVLKRDVLAECIIRRPPCPERCEHGMYTMHPNPPHLVSSDLLCILW
jgi:hypothetical protein